MKIFNSPRGSGKTMRMLDETLVILQEILSNNQRCTKIIGCTLSDENNGDLCATSDEEGKFRTVRIDDLLR